MFDRRKVVVGVLACMAGAALPAESGIAAARRTMVSCIAVHSRTDMKAWHDADITAMGEKCSAADYAKFVPTHSCE
jgi:hypothetical protein